jgi:hypothetical protein
LRQGLRLAWIEHDEPEPQKIHAVGSSEDVKKNNQRFATGSGLLIQVGLKQLS